MRTANPVDFWRGIALVTIFINHIPGITYERFTHRNVSLSDSAELFVFLAGWSMRLLVEASGHEPRRHLAVRLWARALNVYAAQLLIICIAVAMLAGAATLLDNPLLLEWHNAASVFYDPVRAHIGLVLLTHQLGYFDILPLYVVLMMLAPLIVLIDGVSTRLLLGVSILIYLCALTFRITLPSWPEQGEWFFNPLAWQLIYVLGFVLARDEGAGAIARRHLTVLRVLAVPIVVGGALVVQLNWWPDPTLVPEPKLLFLISKPFLTPARLVQFLALAVLMSMAYPVLAAWLPWLRDFMARLGRNSLNVFCVGSVLSLACQILRYVYKGGLILDTALVICGLAMLALTARLSELRHSGNKREPLAKGSL